MLGRAWFDPYRCSRHIRLTRSPWMSQPPLGTSRRTGRRPQRRGEPQQVHPRRTVSHRRNRSRGVPTGRRRAVDRVDEVGHALGTRQQAFQCRQHLLCIAHMRRRPHLEETGFPKISGSKSGSAAYNDPGSHACRSRCSSNRRTMEGSVPLYPGATSGYW